MRDAEARQHFEQSIKRETRRRHESILEQGGEDACAILAAHRARERLSQEQAVFELLNKADGDDTSTVECGGLLAPSSATRPSNLSHRKFSGSL